MKEEIGERIETKQTEKNFGSFLLHRRTELNMSCRQMADHITILGISRNLKLKPVTEKFIERWESKDMRPKPEYFPLISDAYQIKLEELREIFTASETRKQKYKEKFKPKRKVPGKNEEEMFSGAIEFPHGNKVSIPENNPKDPTDDF